MEGEVEIDGLLLQESEKRLKDCVAGKGGNAVVMANGTGKKMPARNSPQQMLIFTVRCWGERGVISLG